MKQKSGHLVASQVAGKRGEDGQRHGAGTCPSITQYTTCENCGHVATATEPVRRLWVRYHSESAGERTYCQDTVMCWHRRNQRDGICTEATSRLLARRGE